MVLRITYLYPHHMNLYGDTGNLLCLQKRCQWRGIDVKITLVNPDDDLKTGNTDLYFFGGGQDAQQEYVAKDLQQHQLTIKEDLDNGTAALTICGGYQLFGHRFITKEGREIPGIGVFDIETYGSNHRMIGNIAIQINTKLIELIDVNYSTKKVSTLVGFENHSGETKILSGKSMGKVTTGWGNDYNSGEEGYWYKNAFGTYMHGSLLPKNPHFADYLIAQALSHQTHETVILPPIDDRLEWQAHQTILNRYTREAQNTKI